ncbi:hypothetical protein POJ06DRAFT_100213 [Lipomyces tetrasporus]|uniref:Luciferase domain-containing protein n=1 Tax=Lipomyces tetrasporus TaxID=54092 RepID=A0AAD7VT11_9ASCO|nr:uncharacterized protein POJ06DRAFT_100213 [Lipomyces tetrasporus]KAJ8100239.1 hypothetical protein POJ06DRAFT_100213 [Lipomyces tetrasporus]
MPPRIFSTLRGHPLLTAAALLCFSAATIPAYQDYQLYMSYGPGGPPYNAFGWFISRFLITPFAQEMFGTEVYQQRINQGETTTFIHLPDGKLPRRKGKIPVVGPHAVPQRQINQLPNEEIKRKLTETFNAVATNNSKLVKLAPSRLERHTDAMWLTDAIPLSSRIQEAVQTVGEVSHIHGTSDHSVHVVLCPEDAKEVIDAGWGQRNGFSGWKPVATLTRGNINLPATYILVYAPRNQEEIEVVMELVRASLRYMSGGAEVIS